MGTNAVSTAARATSTGEKKRVFPLKEEEPETASPHYSGHSAGFHPEDSPHVTTADVRAHLPVKQTRPAYEPDELEAGLRINAITWRYNSIPIPDGVLYQQGNQQIYVHKGTPPIQRAHRGQPQLAAPRKTDEMPVIGPRRRGRVHWLFFVGLALLVMILGYVGITAFSSWCQVHNDDTTYERLRTFQIDAVVGYGDSQSHPSHFIALNLIRHVVIVEIPGGDISKSVIYGAGVLIGDGQDLTPVTLSFSNVNGDMLVHIADQIITFLNNGTKFVPSSNLITGGSNPPTERGKSMQQEKIRTIHIYLDELEDDEQVIIEADPEPETKQNSSHPSVLGIICILALALFCLGVPMSALLLVH